MVQRLLRISVFLAGLLLFSQLPAQAARRIDMGERFPEVSLPQPLEAKQRAYLGLPEGETFTLSQIAADVVLVEMLNVLCPHCRKQTLPYNQLYAMLRKDPETRDRVVMLGVAVGNSDEQIEDFIDIYAVDFPVVPDRSFKLHSAIGGGPTPFSIYLRKDKGAASVVAGTHLGEDAEMEDLFLYLKDVLNLPVSEFAGLPLDDTSERTDVEPFLPPAPMAEKIRKSMEVFGPVSVLEVLKLPSRRQVYRGEAGKKTVFAEVLARSAICDVCHNVYFYYLFDAQGKILAFEPLHLTRHGNIEWSAKETARMRKRVVGGYLALPWNFDPQVDAISSATMTSAIIFNSLDQGKALLEELELNHYLDKKVK